MYYYNEAANVCEGQLLPMALIDSKYVQLLKSIVLTLVQPLFKQPVFRKLMQWIRDSYKTLKTSYLYIFTVFF